MPAMNELKGYHLVNGPWAVPHRTGVVFGRHKLKPTQNATGVRWKWNSKKGKSLQVHKFRPQTANVCWQSAQRTWIKVFRCYLPHRAELERKLSPELKMPMPSPSCCLLNAFVWRCLCPFWTDHVTPAKTPLWYEWHFPQNVQTKCSSFLKHYRPSVNYSGTRKMQKWLFWKPAQFEQVTKIQPAEKNHPCTNTFCLAKNEYAPTRNFLACCHGTIRRSLWGFFAAKQFYLGGGVVRSFFVRKPRRKSNSLQFEFLCFKTQPWTKLQNVFSIVQNNQQNPKKGTIQGIMQLDKTIAGTFGQTGATHCLNLALTKEVPNNSLKGKFKKKICTWFCGERKSTKFWHCAAVLCNLFRLIPIWDEYDKGWHWLSPVVRLSTL